MNAGVPEEDFNHDIKKIKRTRVSLNVIQWNVEYIYLTVRRDTREWQALNQQLHVQGSGVALVADIAARWLFYLARKVVVFFFFFAYRTLNVER